MRCYKGETASKRKEGITREERWSGWNGTVDYNEELRWWRWLLK